MNKDIIIVVAFGALYGSLSFLVWNKTGRHLKFDIIILIGIAIISTYMVCRKTVLYIRGQSLRKSLEEEAHEEAQPDEGEEFDDGFPLPPDYVSNVFKEDFGRVAHDLD